MIMHLSGCKENCKVFHFSVSQRQTKAANWIPSSLILSPIALFFAKHEEQVLCRWEGWQRDFRLICCWRGFLDCLILFPSLRELAALALHFFKLCNLIGTVFGRLLIKIRLRFCGWLSENFQPLNLCGKVLRIEQACYSERLQMSEWACIWSKLNTEVGTE